MKRVIFLGGGAVAAVAAAAEIILIERKNRKFEKLEIEKLAQNSGSLYPHQKQIRDLRLHSIGFFLRNHRKYKICVKSRKT